MLYVTNYNHRDLSFRRRFGMIFYLTYIIVFLKCRNFLHCTSNKKLL